MVRPYMFVTNEMSSVLPLGTIEERARVSSAALSVPKSDELKIQMSSRMGCFSVRHWSNKACGTSN